MVYWSQSLTDAIIEPLTEEDFERNARECKEICRPHREMSAHGQAVGFGSWRWREPGDYTRAEFFATQGHEQRVRTADCSRKDQEERQMLSDDSGLESTWERRTGRNNDDFRKENQVLYDFEPLCIRIAHANSLRSKPTRVCEVRIKHWL